MKKIIYPEIRAVRFVADDVITSSPGTLNDGNENIVDPSNQLAPKRNIWGDGEGTTRLF